MFVNSGIQNAKSMVSVLIYETAVCFLIFKEISLINSKIGIFLFQLLWEKERNFKIMGLIVSIFMPFAQKLKRKNISIN